MVGFSMLNAAVGRRAANIVQMKDGEQGQIKHWAKISSYGELLRILTTSSFASQDLALGGMELFEDQVSHGLAKLGQLYEDSCPLMKQGA